MLAAGAKERFRRNMQQPGADRACTPKLQVLEALAVLRGTVWYAWHSAACT